MSGLSFHPLANIFPLIDGDEFAALVDDVRAHGVREPIWLYEGAILDGRNRYRAAEFAGVDCPMRTFDGADPVSFVVSLNLKRRHLDEAQRAMVAAKLANLSQGRPEATGNKPANLPGFEPPAPLAPVSQSQAAQMLNVSERSVRAAVKVKDEGAPELVHAVETGKASVSAAAEVAKLDRDLQRLVATGGKAAVKETAAAIREDGVEKVAQSIAATGKPRQTAEEHFGGRDADSFKRAGRFVGDLKDAAKIIAGVAVADAMALLPEERNEAREAINEITARIERLLEEV